MFGAKYGLDAKIYLAVAMSGTNLISASNGIGIGGTASLSSGTSGGWFEMGNAKTVTLNLQSGESDTTTRSNNGWKASDPVLKEASVEWEMVWNTGDQGFTLIQQAYFAKSIIGIAVMDGAINVTGNQGLLADCKIHNFTRDEPLTEAITVKVTAKPAYSVNAPSWYQAA